jgi:dihydroorotate dehydrogenase electron transfer subunit
MQEVKMLCGLGNGFDISEKSHKIGKNPLIIGGGVGLPPLYYLAKKLVLSGKRPTVIMGFESAQDKFCEEEFAIMGKVIVTTVDGSAGHKGFVTDALKYAGPLDYYFTCGPEPMLKAVHGALRNIPGQLSFEERMGCGIGTCMGCSGRFKSGPKRICFDGPVFDSIEVMWGE